MDIQLGYKEIHWGLMKLACEMTAEELTEEKREPCLYSYVDNYEINIYRKEKSENTLARAAEKWKLHFLRLILPVRTGTLSPPSHPR